MQESVARLLQFLWRDALAAQQQRVRHFSQRQPERKRGSREERRPVQRLRQHFREFRILHRLRRNNIHRASHRRFLNRHPQNPNDILERHPRHPLLPRPQPPSRPQLERQQHLRQRPALSRQNNSKSRQHHANPQRLRLQCFRFPLPRQPCQKIRPRLALFRQQLVAAVSINSDRRSRHQHARPHIHFRQRLHQRPRRINPARPQHRLPLRRPPPARNRRPRQIHHRIRAHSSAAQLSRCRIPRHIKSVLHFVVRRTLRPHQPAHHVTVPPQRLYQRRSHQSRRSRYQNLHIFLIELFCPQRKRCARATVCTLRNRPSTVKPSYLSKRTRQTNPSNAPSCPHTGTPCP